MTVASRSTPVNGPSIKSTFDLPRGRVSAGLLQGELYWYEHGFVKRLRPSGPQSTARPEAPRGAPAAGLGEGTPEGPHYLHPKASSCSVGLGMWRAQTRMADGEAPEAD